MLNARGNILAKQREKPTTVECIRKPIFKQSKPSIYCVKSLYSKFVKYVHLPTRKRFILSYWNCQQKPQCMNCCDHLRKVIKEKLEHVLLSVLLKLVVFTKGSQKENMSKKLLLMKETSHAMQHLANINTFGLNISLFRYMNFSHSFHEPSKFS